MKSRQSIKELHGISLVGISFSIGKHVLKEVASKEEIETFLKNVKGLEDVKRKYYSGDSSYFNNANMCRSGMQLPEYGSWFRPWIMSDQYRDKYFRLKAENSGIRKLWRQKYTDSFSGDTLYYSSRRIALDTSTGKYGKVWKGYANSNYNASSKMNTYVYVGHNELGDVELMLNSDNSIRVLPRGASICDAIRKLDTPLENPE